MNPPEDDELLGEFLAESFDIIEKMHGDLDTLLQSPHRLALIEGLYRGVHTIKGGSAMFGFEQTKAVAHALENYLGETKQQPERIGAEEQMWIRKEIQKIEQLLKSKERAPLPKEAKPEEARPQEAHTTERTEPPSTSTEPTSAQSAEDFVRVPVGKLDEALGCVAELFLIRNRMVYLFDEFRQRGAHEATQEEKDFTQNWELLEGAMRRSIAELERSVMSMRMTTIAGLFTRMGRVVQTYAHQSGKKIRLHTRGEGTEFDKKVLDVLGEPLVHLIRNAMDHGIEAADVRLGRQKSEEGNITLSAHLRGNEAFIQIQDDGKGLDSEKILESARAKGLNVSHVQSEQAALELIFLPGFSTAEKVSEVSGRGVGMDAVRTSVLRLGGSVHIETQVGVGSTFTIRLPVNMSVATCVLIRSGLTLYAVPNHDIIELKKIDARLLKRNADKTYFPYKNGYIPCLDSREYLYSQHKPGALFSQEFASLIFEGEQGPQAALFTAFEKTTEIIVKPLPRISPQLDAARGLSVLPTGEPIFVLSLRHLRAHPTEALSQQGLGSQKQ